MNDSTVEQEIQDKGLNAPRVTPKDLEDNIVSEHYFTAEEGISGAELHKKLLNNPDKFLVDTKHFHERGYHPTQLLTFCVLVLKNGFTVTGESACASPENFDAELGRKIAKDNAVSKVWPLMGYKLKCDLMEGKV